MKESLKEAGLKKEDILFTLERDSLARKLAWARKKENLEKLACFSRLMREKRGWRKIGEQYSKTLGLTTG